MDDVDLAYFESNFLTDEACSDFDGNGTVDNDDLMTMSAAYGDQNDRLCGIDVVASVDPWDSYAQAFMSPGTQSGVDALSVHIEDSGGVPWADTPVAIRFDGCDDLCTDDPSGLIGFTDANGDVTLDPRVGSCDACTISVEVCGTVVRQYSKVTSPDWDGTRADGVVNEIDLAYFNAQLGGGGDACADFNGDGAVDDTDAALMAAAFGAGDANSVTCDVVGAAVDMAPPLRTRILSSLPNPFNPRAAVQFELAHPGDVLLTIHDVTGRRVRTLASGWHSQGRHSVAWLGRDDAGEPIVNGVYFLSLVTRDGRQAQRLVLLR